MLARKVRAAIDVLIAMPAVRRSRRTLIERPVGALVGKPRVLVPGPPAETHHRTNRLVGERWAKAVDRALGLTSGDSGCLVRAGALCELLNSHGMPRAAVRIGVRRSAAGFEAHAWVEMDGIPIAEPGSLEGGFASLDGVTLHQVRRGAQ